MSFGITSRMMSNKVDNICQSHPMWLSFVGWNHMPRLPTLMPWSSSPTWKLGQVNQHYVVGSDTTLRIEEEDDILLWQTYHKITRTNRCSCWKGTQFVMTFTIFIQAFNKYDNNNHIVTAWPFSSSQWNQHACGEGRQTQARAPSCTAFCCLATYHRSTITSDVLHLYFNYYKLVGKIK